MHTKTISPTIFALILSASFALPASAGDVEAGAQVFRKCKACHVVDSAQNRVGPHLVDVIGRAAGSVAEFTKYSPALRESGIIWDEATLDAYLENPRKYLKGGRMAFPGLPNPTDRTNVIAYLKSFSK